MTLKEFRRGLERYGADFGRWPREAGATARDLAATDPQAAAMMTAALRLDALVSAYDPASDVDDVRAERLVDRVLRLTADSPQAPTPAVVAGPPGVLSAAFAGGGFRRVAMPMAVAAALGVLVGLQLPLASPNDDAEVSLTALVAPTTTSFMGL